METENEPQRADRQCWECSKRRYACDRSLPSCKKCQLANKNCPGYNDQKPLQWLEPGRVSLRPMCKNRPTRVYTSRVSQVSSHKPAKPAEGPTETQDQALEQDEVACTQICSSLKFTTSVKDGSVAFLEHMTQNGPTGMNPEATGHSRQTLFLPAPVYSHLSNDNLEILDAWRYYNERIIPDAKHSELSPNPGVVAIPLEFLSSVALTIHHTVTCAALNHFVLSSPNRIDRARIAVVRMKVFRHRGAAIKALSDQVSNVGTKSSDSTISCIVSFMTMELQDSTPAHWRLHANSLQRLMNMHGGMVKLAGKSPSLATNISLYMVIVVLSNTVSPAGDQLEDCGPPAQQLRDMRALYSLMFPHILCPLALFENIMRINQLRKRAASSTVIKAAQVKEAQEILDDITAFEPDTWAQNHLFEKWVIVGNMYKAAVGLYCITSLQFLGALPRSCRMDILRAEFGKTLRRNLEKGIDCVKIVQYTLWPMIVAGFEAADRDQDSRDWVRHGLLALSRSQGSSSPLKARAALMRFWARDLSGWDECFDRPSMFVV